MYFPLGMAAALARGPHDRSHQERLRVQCTVCLGRYTLSGSSSTFAQTPAAIRSYYPSNLFIIMDQFGKAPLAKLQPTAVQSKHAILMRQISLCFTAILLRYWKTILPAIGNKFVAASPRYLLGDLCPARPLYMCRPPWVSARGCSSRLFAGSCADPTVH